MEENFVKIVGIAFLLYWCFKILLLSGIRAYKEVYLEIHQSIKEIKMKSMNDEIELQLEIMKGK
jgi:hypothetical protein